MPLTPRSELAEITLSSETSRTFVVMSMFPPWERPEPKDMVGSAEDLQPFAHVEKNIRGFTGAREGTGAYSSAVDRQCLRRDPGLVLVPGGHALELSGPRSAGRGRRQPVGPP